MTDLKEPQFMNSEVLEATGLDAATLQTWANRKLVIPASEHPGRSYGHGGKRLYSGEDVIWLALMKHMTDFGIPISTAALILDSNTARGQLRQYGSLPTMFVVTPVEGGYWTTTARPAEEIPEGHESTILNLEKFATAAVNCDAVALLVPAHKIECETTKRLQEIVDRR